MPKLGPIDGKDLVKIFLKFGYRVTGGKGDHITMQKSGSPRPVVIQNKKDLTATIITSNLRTSGMTREQYFKFLSEL